MHQDCISTSEEQDQHYRFRRAVDMYLPTLLALAQYIVCHYLNLFYFHPVFNTEILSILQLKSHSYI